MVHGHYFPTTIVHNFNSVADSGWIQTVELKIRDNCSTNCTDFDGQYFAVFSYCKEQLGMDILTKDHVSLALPIALPFLSFIPQQDAELFFLNL